MALVCNIHSDKIHQTIIRGILAVSEELHIRVIAEGVETAEELITFNSMGIDLFQGYYFARPSFQSTITV